MKRILFSGLVIGTLTASLFVGCNKKTAEQKPVETTTEVAAAPAPAPAQPVVATKPRPAPVAPQAEVAPVVETAPVASAEVNTNELYQKSLDALVSTNSTFRERQEALAELKNLGRLQTAIFDMEAQDKANPGSAETPAMIGQAMLMSISPDMEINQKGILALGADERFDEALKADPNNWDAEYYKAASLAYWPANLNKGPEVQQRLTDLIQQQEGMAQQPQFVRSYVVLGDYYTKSGNNTAAQQIWQQGLTQFPNDPALTKRLSGQ